MKERSEKIRKAIVAIVDSRLPLVTCWCTVKSVSADGQYCDVIKNNNAAKKVVTPGIFLGYEKSGQRLKPTVDTLVLVLFVTKETGVVIMAEKVDGMELMGTNFGEIPVSNSIKTRLNNIESSINSLKTIFSSWVPVANDGGAALKTAAASWANSSLTLTTVNDIKGSVKHGNGQ